MIKRTIAVCLALCLALSLAMTFAEAPAKPQRPTQSDQYIIDSDTRQLTEDELWQWDRESLSFMFNEIFARHGFTFKPGGKFYNHFNALPWYQSTPKVDNSTAYNKTTQLEWDNYHTIKKVIQDMEASGHPVVAKDDSLLSWRRIAFGYSFDTLTGFSYIEVPEGQHLEVYSAPSAGSWRGSNGKAAVSTSGYVYAAGYENNWLLIYYELTSGDNAGGIRVGYVDGTKIKGVKNATILDFSRQNATVQQQCSLTDDPLRCFSTIRTIQAGETVTYLTTMTNQSGQTWDYIETTADGLTVRGFIPAGNIEMPEDEIPEDIGPQG